MCLYIEYNKTTNKTEGIFTTLVCCFSSPIVLIKVDIVRELLLWLVWWCAVLFVTNWKLRDEGG